MSTRPRVALVVGSGGVKCAAAIGLWSVLKEEGIQVDSVTGCSGGSLYCAAIANGVGPEEMMSLSESLWTADVMQGYRENLKASKDGTLRFNDRSGLVDDTVLNANLEKIYGDSQFSDLAIPLKIVATDLHRGEKVVLSEGRIRDAIRASIAIPIIFPPWEIDGRLLIDGGASDPLPIDVAIQDGADIIIAMGFTLSYRTRFRSITAVQEQLTSIYTNNILNSTYAFHNLAHHAEIFPIIPELDEQISMFDVDKIPAVIEKGAQTTREQLPHIRRLLA
ncbi:MAG TPA: patatin-like phospholipase family protein [Spirochaetia bacterium]|nr:patatin-like phospholipase family protein [Spirochaetia bacterium]